MQTEPRSAGGISEANDITPPGARGRPGVTKSPTVNPCGVTAADGNVLSGRARSRGKWDPGRNVDCRGESDTQKNAHKVAHRELDGE